MNKNGICYIVAASTMKNNHPVPAENDYVIAADGGYKNCRKFGITPDIIIGDFDSAEKPDFDNVEVFPVMKDDTDTLLAIKHGLDKGYKIFYVYGGLGGDRIEHTVANIQALGYIAENGGTGFLIGDKENFAVIKNSHLSFDRKAKGYFSVFAFGGAAEGVCIKGAEYLLENAELLPNYPVGVSNRFVGEDVCVSVKNGCLLIEWNN